MKNPIIFNSHILFSIILYFQFRYTQRSCIMEQSTNQCRRYTLPVISSNIEMTKSVTCPNPVPYKISLNSIYPEFSSSKIYLQHQTDKESISERNIKQINAGKEKFEDDLPSFDPLEDVLYIASTTTAR